MAYLILIRHGKSEYNVKGMWTGWHDPELVEEGKNDAKVMASHLKDLKPHIAHTSKLKRAQQTLEIIKQELGLSDLPTHEHVALNERHYGVFTGKNKWQVKDVVGDEEFKKIRRSWDYRLPGGESLKDVHERIVPYYQEYILTDLRNGKNVLIAAHGNSLRALVKHLEEIPDEEMADLEVGIGEVRVYEVDNKGQVQYKEIRNENLDKGKI